MRKQLLNFILLYLLFPVFMEAQNIDLDKQIGAENSKTVEAEMGIYDNKKMTDYFNKVGQKLVSQLEKPLFKYQFKIVPDMLPNAFALPGGYIYITTGILPLLESEDELAGIVGHEIIHSNNRHTIRQAKKSIIPKIFEIPGNLLGVINKDVGRVFNAPIKKTNSLIFASYSRKFETEADDEGIVLAAKAGYDPAQLPKVLTRMNNAIEVITGKKEEKSYFSDHPYTPDRNENLREQAAKLSVAASHPISKSFLNEFDQVQFGESPSKGIIRENIFLHPDINFFVEFPKNWVIDNQSDAVGAYHPDGKAAAFISLVDPNVNAKKAGEEFVKNIDEEYKKHIEYANTYKVNSIGGYLVSFTEETKKEVMYAYILWLPMNGRMYKLLGIAPIEYQDELETSAASLRPLTKSEKASIKENFIKVVAAKEGETIESLSKRTGNKLQVELTAIANDHSLSDKLSEGELIKIVLDKPYLPK